MNSAALPGLQGSPALGGGRRTSLGTTIGRTTVNTRRAPLPVLRERGSEEAPEGQWAMLLSHFLVRFYGIAFSN
jgi:hypothetical protein